MHFPVRGSNPGTGRSVSVELGYDPATGYFFGVDDGNRQLAAGVEIRDLPELIEKTRFYVSWDRKTYQNARDLPVRAYEEQHPNYPTTKILQAVR